MKLFEYTALVKIATVIAAETREEADAEWESIYYEGEPCTALANDTHYAEVIGVTDGELSIERDVKAYRGEGESLQKWLGDEAHIIVEPKGKATA